MMYYIKKLFVSVILFVLLLCCNTAKDTESMKHVRNTSIHEADNQNKNNASKRFVKENEPIDVEIIRDTTPMGCAYEDKTEYVIGNNYIGCRYITGEDTLRQRYLTCLFPPKVMGAIFKKGKDIIPYLISCIDIDDEGGRCGYINPCYSNIHDWVLSNPVGVNYAYMIELIMGKDSIHSIKGADPNGDGWNEVMKPYLLYRQCVIVKKDTLGNPIIEQLKMDDMVKIKVLYSNWWKENNKLELHMMRKKWREKHIFESQPYMWI